MLSGELPWPVAEIPAAAADQYHLGQHARRRPDRRALPTDPALRSSAVFRVSDTNRNAALKSMGEEDNG